MVSAASAIDPEMTTMATCSSAVMPRATRLILTARIPMALASSALSTLSEASWLCGAKISLIAPRKTTRIGHGGGRGRPCEMVVSVRWSSPWSP